MFFHDEHPSYQLMKALFRSKHPDAFDTGASDIQMFINTGYPINVCTYAGKDFHIGDEVTYTQTHAHDPLPA